MADPVPVEERGACPAFGHVAARVVVPIDRAGAATARTGAAEGTHVAAIGARVFAVRIYDTAPAVTVRAVVVGAGEARPAFGGGRKARRTTGARRSRRPLRATGRARHRARRGTKVRATADSGRAEPHPTAARCLRGALIALLTRVPLRRAPGASRVASVVASCRLVVVLATFAGARARCRGTQPDQRCPPPPRHSRRNLSNPRRPKRQAHSRALPTPFNSMKAAALRWRKLPLLCHSPRSLQDSSAAAPFRRSSSRCNTKRRPRASYSRAFRHDASRPRAGAIREPGCWAL